MAYDPFWGASAPYSGAEVFNYYDPIGTYAAPTTGFFAPSAYSDAGFSPAGGDYFSSMPLNDSYWMPTTAVETPWYESAYKELGGLKGVAQLGLGGLSLLGNYLAKKDADELAREQFDRTLGFKEKELETTSATDLAKVDAMMNLLAQRGRVQLDPRRYAEIVASGQIPPEMLATQERVDVGQRNFADGGVFRGALGALKNFNLSGAAPTPQRAGTRNFMGGDLIQQFKNKFQNVQPRQQPRRTGLGVDGGLSEMFAQRFRMAEGGDVGGLLRGGSPGQMDDVNAALSHGEYVMDADVVAALGDGNTEAGAQRLDEMREAIRRHKRSAPADDIPPPARHPLAYLKGMK